MASKLQRIKELDSIKYCFDNLCRHFCCGGNDELLLNVWVHDGSIAIFHRGMNELVEYGLIDSIKVVDDNPGYVLYGKYKGMDIHARYGSDEIKEVLEMIGDKADD